MIPGSLGFVLKRRVLLFLIINTKELKKQFNEKLTQIPSIFLDCGHQSQPTHVLAGMDGILASLITALRTCNSDQTYIKDTVKGTQQEPQVTTHTATPTPSHCFPDPRYTVEHKHNPGSTSDTKEKDRQN